MFPLTGALLLPHGKLPLNIFEPRYLALVEDTLAAGRMFGMIQVDGNRPPAPSGPALYRMGCLGRLSSFSETEDGRYLITLTGMIRFGIVEELAMRRGYRRVRAHYTNWWHDLDAAVDDDQLLSRDELMEALRGYFAAQGFDANWDAIEQMSSETLVTTLCMVCPFAPAEKQALLEAPSTAERAGVLLALLRMGAAQGEPGSRLPS